MKQVYLTRRNLLTLLSKLDRTKAGDPSECTIIKRDTAHCSDVIAVTALEDAEYYTDREAGAVHSKDDPNG